MRIGNCKKICKKIEKNVNFLEILWGKKFPHTPQRVKGLNS